MQPLYVVTTVFNPRRFKSRTELYKHFADWVSTNTDAKLLTVEIAFGDRPHDVTEASNPWHLQLRSRHEIWHKERSLVLGLQHLCRLVPDWQYVAWMDCDIKLARPDWSREAKHLLQHYAVIQMFGEVRSLDPQHQSLQWCSQMTSIMSNHAKYGEIDWFDNPGLKMATVNYDATRNKVAAPAPLPVQPPRAGHPGLAWAFRRKELAAVGGWLDVCVNGSGDLHMAGCFTGKPGLAVPPDVSPGYKAAIDRYGERCKWAIRNNVSVMPGACDHFWHGRSASRGYEDRWLLLTKYKFDPVTDLQMSLDGLYRWNLSDPRVHALAVETRKSLAARNEDGTEV